jgi:uncharacterized membrane protein
VTEDEETASGPSRARREAYDVGRLLAFTDGVFAIAITLLVLNIPVPQLASRATNVTLGTSLLNQSAGLIGFALSFYVVGMQWMLHHRLLRHLERVDGRLLSMNLGYLLFVCLLPFTTAVLVRYGDLAVATAVYAGNVAVAGFLVMGIRVYLHRHRALLDPAAPGATRLGYVRSLLPPGIFLVSIPLAWVQISPGGVSFNLGMLCWVLLIPISRFLYAPIGRQDQNRNLW